MSTPRDLILALEEAFPPDSLGLDLPLVVHVSGADVPVLNLDRITAVSEAPREVDGVLVPGATFVRWTVG